MIRKRRGPLNLLHGDIVIAIELAEVGSLPDGQDFKNAVRDITG